MSRFARWALVTSLALPCATASAVIVAQGNGTQNTSEPFANSGWANVGSVSGASGVYLGDRWVLTAYHVNTSMTGPTSINFGGALGTFNYDGVHAIRLTNPDNSPTDLQMFRLANDPGLPSLNLASVSPTVPTPALMVGYGRNRETALTSWDVTGSSPNIIWTEDPTPESGEAQGYKWAAGSTKRWGSNVTVDLNGAAAGGAVVTTNAGYGTVSVFGTDFDDLANEGQAAAGDSGGGVFDAAGNLIGILDLIAPFEDQPGFESPAVPGSTPTAVFGNLTLAIDIATYRNAILAVIPEPSSASLLLAATGVALARRRRI